MRPAYFIWPLMFLLAGGACTHRGQEEPEIVTSDEVIALVGVIWELAQISRHDGDAALVGAVEPGLYTMTLDPEGSASFRLDCNRGFGRWSGTAMDGEPSGSLSFSQLGVTKALCAPDSISDAVTEDLSRFDRFALNHSELTLSDAQGRIEYVWRPSTPPAEQGGD